MGLIPGPPIRLLDVLNLEAFVQRTIDKSLIAYDTDEREVLLAEGMAIAYELAGKYQPGVGGRDPGSSRFSGYLAMFLPRRLGDAWHKMHPEHRYLTDPATGQRAWRYGQAAISLDGLTGGSANEPESGGDRHLLHARTITEFCHTGTLALLARTTPGASPGL